MIDLLPLQLQYCEAVAEIAKESLPEHWSLDGIKNVLRYDNNIYYVARDLSGKIVGFAGIMLVADEAELLNIAVSESFRGRGIGQELLTKVLSKASQKGTQRMLLEVRKSNTSAINLYHKNGFVELGERKNYYSNPKEDAIIMERRL